MTLDNGLTPFEIAAIEYYLQCFNQTRAYELAGKQPDTSNASKFFNQPKIKEEIERRLAEGLKVNSDYVMARLVDHAEASLDDFMEFIDEPNLTEGDKEKLMEYGLKQGFVFDLEKARKNHKLHLIKKIKFGKLGLEIELQDQQNAIIQIGKALGVGVGDEGKPKVPESRPGEVFSKMVDAMEQEKGKKKRAKRRSNSPRKQ